MAHFEVCKSLENTYHGRGHHIYQTTLLCILLCKEKRFFQLFEDMTTTIIFFEDKPPLNEAQISTEMY